MNNYNIGDEVIYNNKVFVVTGIVDKSIIYLLHSSGTTVCLRYYVKYSEGKTEEILRRTGRTYPELIKILKSLEEMEK